MYKRTKAASDEIIRYVNNNNKDARFGFETIYSAILYSIKMQ